MHEASLYEQNSFITLTYNNDHLPPNGSIVVEHTQDFMKRLRDRICSHTGCKVQYTQIKGRKLRWQCSGRCPKIRSFGCAEYGEKLSRPHYHIVLFNWQFPDLKFWRYSGNDWSDKKWPVYRSQMLEELWTYGFSEVGTVTFESVAYVARYVTKKINGAKKETHYGDKLPERAVCVSNREGIGLPWLKKHAKECLATDSVVIKGKENRVPRYYCKKLEDWFPEKYAVVKQQRLNKIKTIDLDATKKRLQDRAYILELRFKKLTRSYENATQDLRDLRLED